MFAGADSALHVHSHSTVDYWQLRVSTSHDYEDNKSRLAKYCRYCV